MIRGNEPSMPCLAQYDKDGNLTNFYQHGVIAGNEYGLTIRQHFAAMAMQGILSNPHFLEQYSNIDIHIASVYNADALIAALNK